LLHNPRRATTANNLSLNRVVVLFFMDIVQSITRSGLSSRKAARRRLQRDAAIR
jgi:hypothetical protein